jgi:hypothetical protein
VGYAKDDIREVGLQCTMYITGSRSKIVKREAEVRRAGEALS